MKFDIRYDNTYNSRQFRNYNTSYVIKTIDSCKPVNCKDVIHNSSIFYKYVNNITYEGE